ncbi:MAG: MFS transporter [Acidimicrobiia bacterium]
MRRQLTTTLASTGPETTAVLRDALDALPGPTPDTFVAALPHPPLTDATLELTTTTREHATTVTLTALSPTPIPYWGWIAAPLIGHGLRRSLRIAEARVQAGVAGMPTPAVRRSRLLPDAPFTPDQARSLAVVCAAIAIGNFGASLLGQNASYIADAFGANDQALGFLLAVTRVGVLVSLVAGMLSDRFGRRRLVLFSLAAIAGANLVSALAPTFTVVAGAQVLTRGFINALLVVGAIVAVEEAPEGARAFAISMFSLAAGFGFAISVIFLALNDLGPWVWRALFGVSALTLVLVPGLARRLRETRRFQAILERETRPRVRWRELVNRRYGPRLALLGGIAFLTNVLAAPSSQLTNRYLDQVQHFSASEISLYRAVTAGIPGIVAVLVAGRLADRRGRKPLGIIGLALGGALQAAFFLGSSWTLWIAGTASIFTAALAGVAIGTLDTELFATEMRSTANALVVVISVLGSALGLVLAGSLADPLGGLGNAIAILTIAPIAAALLLLPRLPESAYAALDEVSPSEFGPGRPVID